MSEYSIRCVGCGYKSSATTIWMVAVGAAKKAHFRIVNIGQGAAWFCGSCLNADPLLAKRAEKLAKGESNMPRRVSE